MGTPGGASAGVCCGSHHFPKTGKLEKKPSERKRNLSLKKNSVFCPCPTTTVGTVSCGQECLRQLGCNMWPLCLCAQASVPWQKGLCSPGSCSCRGAGRSRLDAVRTSPTHRCTGAHEAREAVHIPPPKQAPPKQAGMRSSRAPR